MTDSWICQLSAIDLNDLSLIVDIYLFSWMSVEDSMLVGPSRLKEFDCIVTLRGSIRAHSLIRPVQSVDFSAQNRTFQRSTGFLLFSRCEIVCRLSPVVVIQYCWQDSIWQQH